MAVALEAGRLDVLFVEVLADGQVVALAEGAGALLARVGGFAVGEEVKGVIWRGKVSVGGGGCGGGCGWGVGGCDG